MLRKSIRRPLVKWNFATSDIHLILLLLLKLLLIHNLLLQIIRTTATVVVGILLHQVRLIDYNLHILSTVALLVILGVLSCFAH
jgi:hypothetical protein